MERHEWSYPETDIDETGAWLSIGDLMSGLLMIFALLLILALLQLTEAAEKAKSGRIVIIQSLQKTLSEKGINAEVDPQTGDISILDSVLFDIDSAALKPAGHDFLELFVPAYSNAIFSSDDVANEIQHVVIEGHTSSTGSWDYNMNLSLNRANSVSEAVSRLSFMGKGRFRARMLVAGRGEADADQSVDRPGDRKVIFRFQFKSDRFLHWFMEQRGL
ncbi:chemotaxis protein MotB [Marinobacterium aestuarii]|uniref:Chemotaxis protein MotB n=1 Tax=Marinobacterium aestuarii TaxID=1821621 RepID=A0A1A9EYN8_9GAMM|nr:OmpA family protein [Marinobacterium aestuarii]ANG63066.1 chemotaxis protein MotB [Marinobacterium aestuarii]